MSGGETAIDHYTNQIPPDFVVKSQAIDVAEVILALIRQPTVVSTLWRNRQSRREWLSTSETHESTTKSDGMWNFPENIIESHSARLLWLPHTRWRGQGRQWCDVLSGTGQSVGPAGGIRFREERHHALACPTSAQGQDAHGRGDHAQRAEPVC